MTLMILDLIIGCYFFFSSALGHVRFTWIHSRKGFIPDRD
jgi:hypothetical protein